MEYVELICEKCGIVFPRKLSKHTKNQKQGNRIFCSHDCARRAPRIKKVQYEHKCDICNITFKHLDKTRKYCSRNCFYAYKSKPFVTCLNCSVKFQKARTEIRNSPNHFCSHSCAAIYNNAHKTKGTRRSRLECYLEEQIKFYFPYLLTECNSHSALESHELDFYFPDLNLAFEIQGIFHYQPIYGEEKLQRIQEIDQFKIEKAQEKSIELIKIKSIEDIKIPGIKERDWKIMKNIILSKIPYCENKEF